MGDTRENPYKMPEGQVIVNVSGGRTSGMMAVKIWENNPDRSDIHYLFQNTGRERPQTYDFIRALQDYGIPIIMLEYRPTKPWFEIVGHNSLHRDSEPFTWLTDKRKYLPNIAERFCTEELKVKTARRYMRSLGYMKYHVVIGFRAEEKKRIKDMMDRREIALNKKRGLIEIPLLPLVDAEIFALDVKAFWAQMPFDLNLPILPNGKTVGGNCVGCFMHSESDRARVARDEPEQWQWLIEQEEKIGGTFLSEYSCAELQRRARSQLVMDYGDENIFCVTAHGGCTD